MSTQIDRLTFLDNSGKNSTFIQVFSNFYLTNSRFSRNTLSVARYGTRSPPPASSGSTTRTQSTP